MNLDNITQKSKEDYTKYELGSKPNAYKRLIDKFQNGGERSEKDEFLKIKGPFQSQLSLTTWSDQTWEEFAEDEDLEEAVKQAFSNFDRLMQHQQETVRAVEGGKDTLVSAGTGKGKTEAWFIPLVNDVIKEKRGEEEQSTKSLIIYPTKALAQDQYKRFIEYLSRVNKNLDDEITIGIYDGDTPQGTSSETLDELMSAFNHIDNPLGDEGMLVPSPAPGDEEGYKLKIRKDEKGEEEIVDFVHLTRQKIEREKSDIILTNPDAINYRLIDVNNDTSHETFVKQPKHVVFDEIHLYKGQLGAHTSMVLRRMENIKKETGEDFQYIASSATVANKEELFSRIFNLKKGDMEVVTEENLNASLKWDSVTASTPNYLFNQEIELGDLKKDLKEGTDHYPKTVRDLNIEKGMSGDEIRQNLSKVLLENESDLSTHLLHYHELSKHIIQRESVKDEYISHGFSKEDASRLVENLNTILEALGAAETRKHIFMWPLDGLYSCVKCGAIYNDPKNQCQNCDSEFVTKVNVCDECGQEIYEGWYCPKDNEIQPTKVSEEGRMQYYETPSCPQDETHKLYRIYWVPHYQCSECGKSEPREKVSKCSSCGAPTKPTENGYKCINDECGQTQDVHGECNCGGEMVYKGDPEFQCKDCGNEQDTRSCECGGNLVAKVPMHWKCRNCGELYKEKPEGTCRGCSKRTYSITGLVDANEFSKCSECGNEYYKGYECGCSEDAEMKTEWKNLGLKTIDSNGKLRNPGKFKECLPCYHGSKTSYNPYSPIMLSPAHRAVTFSQMLLRNIHSKHDAVKTKLLAFSDSYNDVEELNVDFTEPERQFFIYQLIMDGLEDEEKSIEELQNSVVEEAEKYFDGNKKDQFMQKLTDDRNEQYQTSSIKGFVRGRILGGRFPTVVGHIENHPSGGDLRRRKGLVACKLSSDVDIQTDEEKEVISELIERPKSKASLKQDYDSDAIARLQDADILEYDGQKLDVNLEKIICSAPSQQGMYWDPDETKYYDKLDLRMGETSEDWVELNESYAERSNYSHNRFDRDALVQDLSQPFFHISDTYRGDNDPSERREKESRFKDQEFPNFLSSTSALEVGLDIGSLNYLMLFGVPPNINSYLQRVGRAGREEGKSLVTSISKRNPIDYYYYHHPKELIVESDVQPVPINENNEYVIESHLTWAVLDCIAERFKVNWREDNHKGHDMVSAEKYYHKDQEEEYDLSPDYHFNTLYNVKKTNMLIDVHSLKDGNDPEYPNAFSILGELIEKEREEIEEWLESMLDYSYCQECGLRYPDVVESQKCVEEGCSGEVKSMADQDKISQAIDDAMDKFSERMYEFPEEEIKIWDQRAEEALQNTDLSRSEKSNRLNKAQKAINQIGGRELAENHRKSKYAKYHFNLRSSGETVEVRLGDNKQFNSRGRGMALKELHPYALYRYNGDEFVVRSATADDEATEELLHTSDLSEEIMMCPDHGDQGKSDVCKDAECNRDTIRVEPKVLKSVNLARSRKEVHSEKKKINIRDVYPLSSSSYAQSTFPNIRRGIDEEEFETQEKVVLKRNGEKYGKIEYGQTSIEKRCLSYKTKYRSGTYDQQNFLELCEECGNIVTQRHGEAKVCIEEPGHEGTKKIMPINHFRTNVVKIEFRDEDVAHTLTHGLRTALQKIGGAEPREMQEIEGEDSYYLFESEEGGNGLLSLLFEGSGTSKLEEALDVIEATLDSCGCENRDGCPKCTYQRGCYRRNTELTKVNTISHLEGLEVEQT
jgi:superfamily II DNA helicase RecQ